jgi:hypothetical protein
MEHRTTALLLDYSFIGFNFSFLSEKTILISNDVSHRQWRKQKRSGWVETQKIRCANNKKKFPESNVLLPGKVAKQILLSASNTDIREATKSPKFEVFTYLLYKKIGLFRIFLRTALLLIAICFYGNPIWPASSVPTSSM